MAQMWITTIGLFICLGLIAGVLFHFLKVALITEDSLKIDPLPDLKDEKKHN